MSIKVYILKGMEELPFQEGAEKKIDLRRYSELNWSF